MCESGELRPPPGAAPPPADAAAAPHFAQLNVTDRSRMHIGPRFVSVTQTVHATEVVEDVGVARYVWEWARRTSRAERLACAAALAALVLCAALLAAFAAPRDAPQDPDVAPHAWNISRKMWLSPASVPADAEPWPARFLPLRLVVVQHTAGRQCHRFAECSAVMLNLQLYYFSKYGYGLPYNFVVGNDGRVYEGRGWRAVGAHTRGYNLCALGLAFTGTYTDEGGARASAAQLEHARALLEDGVRAGVLHARYRVLAARDVQSTVSPGEALVAELRAWPSFVAEPEAARRFRNRSCDNIYAADDDDDAHEVS